MTRLIVALSILDRLRETPRVPPLSFSPSLFHFLPLRALSLARGRRGGLHGSGVAIRGTTVNGLPFSIKRRCEDDTDRAGRASAGKLLVKCLVEGKLDGDDGDRVCRAGGGRGERELEENWRKCGNKCEREETTA